MDEAHQYKPDTLNQIEEKMENNLELIGIRIFFLKRTLLVQALRSTINDAQVSKLIKLKSFNRTKDHHSDKMNQQPTEWGKTFTNYISGRDLVSNIYFQK